MLGLWGASSANPLRRQTCVALESVRRREAMIEEYKNRCDPLYVRKDIFNVRLRIVEIRRVSTNGLRGARCRVEMNLPPANSPGMEDVLGRVGEERSERRRFC